MSLLRGRVRVALVATAVWVPGFVLAQWAFPGASEGTSVRDPAMLALGAVVLALPLLAILAVLVWRGGARPRSWAWLLLPAALTISYGWAPLVWLLAAIVMVVGLVAALPLAAVTGEVRPAVALAVPCVPPMLGTVLATPVSAALVVTALAAWGAVRARQRKGPGRPAGGPAPHKSEAGGRGASALARRVPPRGGRNARPLSPGPSGPTRVKLEPPQAARHPRAVPAGRRRAEEEPHPPRWVPQGVRDLWSPAWADCAGQTLRRSPPEE